MKHLARKILLTFLTLSLLFSSSYSYFAPPAKAQCPPGAEEPYCASAIAVCVAAAVASPIASTIFNGNIELCTVIVYHTGRMIFASPPPTPWYDPDITTFARKVFDQSNPDEIFGERYTYAQVNWILNSIITMIFPPLHAADVLELFQMIADIVNAVNDIRNTVGNLQAQTPFVNTLSRYGFVGQTYFVMTQVPQWIFTDRIASGVDEVKYVASKLNIASPAYAQGLGYDKLSIGNIRSLWIATRNMAYLIAVVILIIGGFMVIFRQKISAQASVTIQMIIPRLVISLVLVTFSFAIVGFVIDLLYVAITAVLGLVYFSQGATGVTLISDLPYAITAMTTNFDFVTHFLKNYIVIAILLLLITVIFTLLAAWGTIGAAGVVAPLMGFILGFFMWSIYLWARVVGQLVVAYITLILLTVAGPIMIIFDVLPTSSGGFKKWLLCVIGNVSVFFSYAMMSILVSLLFANTTLPGFADNSSGAIINAGFDLPLFKTGYPAGFIMQFLIFIGFMSGIPNIVASIKDMFCKSTDFSSFIENTVKDTVGQFTKAGQEAGKSVESYRAREIAKSQASASEAAKNAQSQSTPTVQ